MISTKKILEPEGYARKASPKVSQSRGVARLASAGDTRVGSVPGAIADKWGPLLSVFVSTRYSLPPWRRRFRLPFDFRASSVPGSSMLSTRDRPEARGWRESNIRAHDTDSIRR